MLIVCTMKMCGPGGKILTHTMLTLIVEDAENGQQLAPLVTLHQDDRMTRRKGLIACRMILLQLVLVQNNWWGKELNRLCSLNYSDDLCFLFCINLLLDNRDHYSICKLCSLNNSDALCLLFCINLLLDNRDHYTKVYM